MKIKSLAHVCIKTRDLKRTQEFYCDILGLEKAFDFVRDGKPIGFYLKTGNNTFIEVFESDRTETSNPERGLHHFCFETETIEDLHQKLRDSGYSPRELIMGADQALQFWVQDPNGLDLEFQQYTDQSSQLNGRTVEVR